MRSPLPLALAASLGLSGVAVPKVAWAAPDPEALYEEGRKDYAEGRFEDGIKKMKEAYKRSDDPLMLYSIGQAYRDWYDTSKDVEHLREAKLNLEKFIVALQADPNLGDPADIEPAIEEIEQLIDKAAQAPEPDPEPEPEPEPEPAPDPGKRQRGAGVGLMAAGGALFAAGAGVGIAFGLKGLDLREQIDALNLQFAEAGCDDANISPGTCANLEAMRAPVREDGKRANLLTGVGWGVLGGVGVAMLVAGGVLYAKGKRTSAEWQAGQARLRILPSVGGLVISGRF